jgi:hypothetical protein
MTLKDWLDLMNTPAAVVGAVWLGIWIKGRLATFSSKKELEAHRIAVASEISNHADTLSGGLKELGVEIRGGLNRLDQSQTEHYGQMYNKLDVLKVDVGTIRGAFDEHVRISKT